MASSDSFGTFLETRNLLRKGGQPEDESKHRPEHSRELTESTMISVSLVRDYEFPIPIHELLKQSGLSLDQFKDALQAIRRADLVEVQRDGEGEVAVLTVKGRQFQEATRGSDVS